MAEKLDAEGLTKWRSRWFPRVEVVDRSEARPKPKTELALPSTVLHGLSRCYADLLLSSTEAPVEYHVGTLHAAVGILIGRRAWISNPHPSFPNFYMLLIGETGDTRKTTAYRFGVDLVRDVGARTDAKAKPLHGLASVEGLATAMKDSDSPDPYRILCIEDEFRSLLKKSQQKAVANLIPRLTEAYNCLASFEVNTKHDRIVIDNPFLSIVASSTGSWFIDSITANDISGGFLNRWIIFRGKPEKLIPFPEPVDPDEPARRFLAGLNGGATPFGQHAFSTA